MAHAAAQPPGRPPRIAQAAHGCPRDGGAASEHGRLHAAGHPLVSQRGRAPAERASPAARAPPPRAASRLLPLLADDDLSGHGGRLRADDRRASHLLLRRRLHDLPRARHRSRPRAGGPAPRGRGRRRHDRRDPQGGEVGGPRPRRQHPSRRRCRTLRQGRGPLDARPRRSGAGGPPCHRLLRDARGVGRHRADPRGRARPSRLVHCADRQRDDGPRSAARAAQRAPPRAPALRVAAGLLPRVRRHHHSVREERPDDAGQPAQAAGVPRGRKTGRVHAAARGPPVRRARAGGGRARDRGACARRGRRSPGARTESGGGRARSRGR